MKDVLTGKYPFCCDIVKHRVCVTFPLADYWKLRMMQHHTSVVIPDISVMLIYPAREVGISTKPPSLL